MNVRSKDEKRMEAIAHIVMILLCATAILPFALLIIASFTDETVASANGYSFFPEKLSSLAYQYIGAQWVEIGRAHMVTIVVTVVGTFLCVMISSMFAYGLTIKGVPGTGLISFLMIFAMLFNGGLVATYYTYCNFFHIRNTIWALIVPGLLMNAFNVILLRNYMVNSIPGELVEAAEMDGAGQFRIFFRIIMPLSRPIIATVGLMAGIGYWNDWNNGLYYITDSELYSVQQLLNQMNQNVQFMANNAKLLGIGTSASLPSTTIRMAIAVIAIIPILCIYPFFQKYFVKGITMGSVKG